MRDLTMGKFTWTRKLRCCFLIVLLSLVSQYALSADTTLSLTCSNTDMSVYLGNVIPLSPFQTHFAGTCKVNSTFIASGGFYTQIQSGKGNTTGRDLSVVAAASGYPVPYESALSDINCFEPSNCERRLTAGDTFPYDFILSGTTHSTPGLYVPMVTLYGTDRGFGNTVTIGTVIVAYTVVQPACSMSSASQLSLGFGALTSNDFASSQQVAEISLSCTAATQVNVTLVPTQSAVTGSPGVSATTLDGLSMAATWADSKTAVVFNTPRSFAMSKGTNLIQLGFRPQLNAGSSPVGDFSSQYTLNIVYP